MIDARARMLQLAQRLYTGGTVTSEWIREQFAVSKATAKRDLVILEQQLPVLVEFRRQRDARTRVVEKAMRLREVAS